MRLAVLSDVHSNREALEACLKHAREHGVDRLAFLGDLVGYGGDPGPVVDRVAELAGQGAWVVMGNHDHGVSGGDDGLDGEARRTAELTARALSDPQRSFLAGLPLSCTEDRLLLVHSSAHRPETWPYIVGPDSARESFSAAPRATHTFVGHTHHQRLYYLGSDGRAYAFTPSPGVAIPVPAPRRWLALVGSVGQPRDRNTAAAYVLYDSDARRITFHRVPYDWQRAAARIREVGLPGFFADRLADGV